MIRAIALDDEPPALEIIQSFCDRLDNISLKKTFTKTTAAANYLSNNEVDLIFLDINMPSVNGMDFYKSLPDPLIVIFTSAYSEYAAESYEVQALDFLVKPFTFKRFFQAVTKAEEYIRQKKNALPDNQDQLVLKVEYGLQKISLADIDFIEGLDNYLKIHLAQKSPLVVRMTLKTLLEKLPQPAFIRVHRSYIVPLNKVVSVRNKVITLQCGEEITIGSSYETAFLNTFGH
jgi:DNA-binding LytR/AlgR family response regulator